MSVSKGPATRHTVTPVVAEQAAPVTPSVGDRPCLCDASTWAMAARGPRSAIVSAEIGNSRPPVVCACALLDPCSSSPLLLSPYRPPIIREIDVFLRRGNRGGQIAHLRP